MKNQKFIKIILAVLCVISITYGKTDSSLYSSLVAQAIGLKMSHESLQTKNRINIDLSRVQKSVAKYLKDRGFRLKMAVVTIDEHKGDQHYTEGLVIHADRFGRNIETKFKTMYKIQKRRYISIKDIHLQNYSVPSGMFFIVPANRLDTSSLKNLSFKGAFKRVNSVARKLNSFNIEADIQPVNYKLVVFLMNRLNRGDDIYSVFSTIPFSQKGQIAKNIETKDGWRVMILDAKFAYNGGAPKYLNILWKKDDYLIPIASYSTHSLIKSIQTALSEKGYDVGYTDGKLNNETKKAIRKYLANSGFSKKSKLSDDLLWFMRQYRGKNVSKIVQAALIINGINIGTIDGKIGPNTIRGIKKYQKKFGIKGDGRITPELVRLLLATSKNVAVYSRMRNYFEKPISLNSFHDKMWKNEL